MNYSSLSYVRQDPSIPEYYAERELAGLDRRSAGLDRRGKAKKPMTKAQKRKRTSIIHSLPSLPSESSPAAINLPPDHPVHKKRRVSADKALVKEYQHFSQETLSLNTII
jgi:hypothetical protein